MREVQGTTWIFGLVITFIFLFAAFLILAINYTDSFRIRNDIITIIEEYEGYHSTSAEIINDFLLAEGYKTTGKCPTSNNESEPVYQTVSNLDSYTVINAENGTNYSYCVKNEDGIFEIILFYKFNLPVIGNFLTFQIKGTTNKIMDFE